MFIQINQALKHASLKSYSLYKDGDGDQCLDLYMRDPIKVLLELFSDSSASGKQYFVYEEYRNKDGEREFYHTNGALWWQWAQAKAIELGGPGTGVCSIVFSINATFAKKNTYYIPLYCELLYCLGTFIPIRMDHFLCISYCRNLFRIFFVFETFISYVFRMYFVLYSQIDLIENLANAVTSGNFNVEIKKRYSSYKLLALFPPFNSAACPGMSPQQAAFRRKELLDNRRRISRTAMSGSSGLCGS